MHFILEFSSWQIHHVETIGTEMSPAALCPSFIFSAGQQKTQAVSRKTKTNFTAEDICKTHARPTIQQAFLPEKLPFLLFLFVHFNVVLSRSGVKVKETLFQGWFLPNSPFFVVVVRLPASFPFSLPYESEDRARMGQKWGVKGKGKEMELV